MPPDDEFRSDIAFGTSDRFVVRGHDLPDLIGHVGFGDFAFLELQGRLPTPQESTVFNAITITLVEHGLTPSAIAARLTVLGAPESLQGAVAAGLLGLGDRFGGSVEDAARMLQEGLALADDQDPRSLAESIVDDLLTRRERVPGIGHPVHTAIDPRVAPLLRVAAANGFSGRYVDLMDEVAEAASRATGRSLPMNATGAIGAIASELGLPWESCRGIAVMARAVGLVAHIQEERQRPLAPEVWRRTEEQAQRHHAAGLEARDENSGQNSDEN